MTIRALLLLLGLFHAANGVWMLAAPESWYWSVPGVVSTGPLNHHFISDIAMAFLASGVGLALGARSGPRAASFAVAGAKWPALHSVIHVAGWIMHGFPTEPRVALSETIGVVGIALFGAVLAILRIRGEP